MFLSILKNKKRKRKNEIEKDGVLPLYVAAARRARCLCVKRVMRMVRMLAKCCGSGPHHTHTPH